MSLAGIPLSPLTILATQAPTAISVISGVRGAFTPRLFTPRALFSLRKKFILPDFKSAGILLQLVEQSQRAGIDLFSGSGDAELARRLAPNVPLLGRESPLPTFYWYQFAAQITTPDGSITSPLVIQLDSPNPLSRSDIQNIVLMDAMQDFRLRVTLPGATLPDDPLENSVIFVGVGFVLKREPIIR